MKSILLILFFIFPGIVSCQSKEKNSGENMISDCKPHEEVTVNKKYDEKGNLNLVRKFKEVKQNGEN